MADTNNRENGIQIDISYKYDSSGMQKAIADVSDIDTRTERGISKTKQNIKNLIAASQEMAQYLSKDSETVASALKKQAAALDAVTKAEYAYKNAQSRVKAAKQNLKSVKDSIINTKAGTPRKNVSISGTTVYKKTSKGNVVDEQATNKLVAATERLKQARTSLNSILVSVQSKEDAYKQSILATAEAQHKAEIQAQKDAEKAEAKAAKDAEKAKKEAEIQYYSDLNKELGLTQEQQDMIAKGQKKLNLADLVEKVDKLGKKIKKLDLQKLVAKLFAIRRAWQQLLKFTNASSSWVENLNLLEVVFANTADKAKEFVKLAADDFGLDANALAQYVSTFKQMANAMGQAAETGTQMAEALTYLALDISSLRNVDLKTAASDLASGIAGQVKPVRKYGFDITETSVNELLKELGGGSSSSLTQANKQLARTILLIRQSKDAWGDMAKTINTFANQQRVMNDQWETTKRLLGTILVGTFKVGDTFAEASKTAGIATKAIWYINGALLALNQMLEVMIPQADTVNGAVGTGAEEAADAYDDLDDAVNGSLASFDKFNTLSSGSGKIDLTNGLTELFGKEYADYMKKFKDSMKDINMYSKEIANTFLKIAFPNFATWLESNPAGTFSEWAKSSGEVGDNVAEIGKSLFGVLATILSIQSPLLAIFAALAKEAILDPSKFNGLIDLGTEFMQTFMEISGTIYELVTALAPLVLAFIKATSAITNFLAQSGLLIPVLTLVAGAIVGIKITLFIFELEKTTGLVTLLSKKFDEMRVKSGQAFTSMFNNTAKLNGALKNTNNQFTMANAAVSMLAFTFTLLISDSIIGKFEGESKKVVAAIFLVVGAITAAIVAAFALKSVISWGQAIPIMLAGLAASIAGVKGLIDANIPQHADGGFQKGGLFYAGERGAEWVGRQGNTSTIVNDTQMSDIMRDSVAQGVIQANIASRTTSQKQRPIVLNVDGKKFLEIVESEASKNGKELARVK